MSTRQPPPPASSPGDPCPITLTFVRGREQPTCLLLGAGSGLLLHWPRSRSLPCPGEADCPPAVHRGKTTFKLYLPALLWSDNLQRWAPTVLEVSAGVEEILRGRSLQGEVWQIFREKPKVRSSRLIALLIETRPTDGLPRAHDVRPTVCRYYGTERICWDVSNPAPPRTYGVLVDAPPPAGLPDLVPEATPGYTEADAAEARRLLREARDSGPLSRRFGRSTTNHQPDSSYQE